MNKQKKYFYNFLIIFLIFSIVVVGSSMFFIVKIKSPHPNNYTSAYLDKMELLKVSKNKKRIVFIGGSNLVFGLNSEKIYDTFSDYEIVNTSVHAGIGLRYMLEDIKKYLTNQDLIIIAPEYNHFYTGSFGGSAMWEVVSAKKSLDSVKLGNLVNSMPEFLPGFLSIVSLQENKNFGKIFTYDRRGFNKYGDYVEHWKYEPKTTLAVEIISGEKLDESFLLFFQEFKNEMEEQGIKYIILPPVITATSFQSNKEKIENIASRKEINFNAKPEEFAFSDELFFDTIYHLNKQGVEMRTDKMIAILKEFFESPIREK